MQFAQVLINTKTDKLFFPFTYKIPAKLLPYIKIGVQVKVPFRNSVKDAIIYKIVRRVDKKIINKLKNIKSVVSKYSLINSSQFELAKLVSNYYLANYGQLLHFMTPKISINYLKKHSVNFTKLQNNNKISGIYNIIGSKDKRVDKYIQIISKNLKSKRSIILIFPDYKANIFYINKLKNIFKNTIIEKPSDTKTQNTINWINTKGLSSKLIIGTRNTIFKIDQSVKSIIIDEPNDFGYKEEQTIHHHTKVVAELAKQLFNCYVFYGQNYSESSYPKILNNIKKNHTLFIDQDSDTNFPPGNQAIKLIEKTLEKKNNLLIITSGNTDKGGIICQDCKHILSCPRCEHVLRKNNDYVLCPKCNYKNKVPTKCPSCNSIRLVGFGLTTKSLYKKLSSLFPKKIKLLENSALDKITLSHSTIYISNPNIRNYSNLKFNNVYIVNWSDIANRYYYDFYERDIINILKFKELSLDNLYIRGNDDDVILKKLLTDDFQSITKIDQQNRYKYHYPPFYKIIRISDRSTTQKNNKIIKLRKKLIGIIKENYVSEINTNPKTRGKFLTSIDIVIPDEKFWETKLVLRNNYQKLKLSDFQINVDPINF